MTTREIRRIAEKGLLVGVLIIVVVVIPGHTVPDQEQHEQAEHRQAQTIVPQLLTHGRVSGDDSAPSCLCRLVQARLYHAHGTRFTTPTSPLLACPTSLEDTR
jgi:hypothetical protein